LLFSLIVLLVVFDLGYNASKDFELWKKKLHSHIGHSELLSTFGGSSDLNQGMKRARNDGL